MAHCLQKLQESKCHFIIAYKGFADFSNGTATSRIQPLGGRRNLGNVSIQSGLEFKGDQQRGREGQAGRQRQGQRDKDREKSQRDRKEGREEREQQQ